ncbi:hypothetical protein M433DRAFT_137243 [Acidomyces richmondensis BFW]|nr:MAG: hypothetical protein FE78DRAFT_26871 [Acidomyces sp. 'richmondensis']KYG42454.1 hypothetical protein M433DRAFT_137243 [Acidomyces richmondensis BFW]
MQDASSTTKFGSVSSDCAFACGHGLPAFNVVFKVNRFLNHDPFPSIGQLSPPLTPTKHKLQSFSSSLGLSVFAKGAIRTESPGSSVSEGLEDVKEPDDALATPMNLPARQPSVRTKMIAREANEHPPPVVLPPCAESYQEEENFTFRSATRCYGPSLYNLMPSILVPNTGKLHKQQRSYSTAWITS